MKESCSIILQSCSKLLREIRNAGIDIPSQEIEQHLKVLDSNICLSENQSVKLQSELVMLKQVFEKNRILKYAMKMLENYETEDRVVDEVVQIIESKENIVTLNSKTIKELCSVREIHQKINEVLRNKNCELTKRIDEINSKTSSIKEITECNNMRKNVLNLYETYFQQEFGFIHFIKSLFSMCFLKEYQLELNSANFSNIRFKIRNISYETMEKSGCHENKYLDFILTKNGDGDFEFSLISTNDGSFIDMEKYNVGLFAFRNLITLFRDSET